MKNANQRFMLESFPCISTPVKMYLCSLSYLKSYTSVIYLFQEFIPLGD